MQFNHKSMAAQFGSSPFSAAVVDTQPVRVQSSLMLSQLLKDIDFHGVVEKWCADEGDVPSSKVLEAYVHCRFNSPDPVPVSRFEEWVSRSCLPQLMGEEASKFNESRLGRVLELVGQAPQAMWIELIANTHRHFKIDLSHIINDTTSFYFEGEYLDSGLAKYGYSRDGKPDCKQVNVSVNVSGEHSIPLLYKPLPGNTADVNTVATNVAQLCTLFKALGEVDKKVVVVADKGLLTLELIHYYKGVNVGYVGTLKRPKFDAAVIRGVSDASLLASQLAYCAERYADNPKKRATERYYGVRRNVTFPAFAEEGVSYPELQQAALVVFSEGKKRLDAGKRDDFLAKTEKRLAEISGHLNMGKYRKEDYAQQQIDKAISRYPGAKDMVEAVLSSAPDGTLSLDWKRNTNAIKEVACIDGKYVVYTSEDHLSNDELFDKFKSRDRVEKRIAALKGPVVVRPIYLHKDERILGLIFANMTALLLYGLIEMLAMRNGKKITAEEVQRQLNDYSGSVLTFADGSQVTTFPHGNIWQRGLHAAIGLGLVGRNMIICDQAGSPTTTHCPWTDCGP